MKGSRRPSDCRRRAFLAALWAALVLAAATAAARGVGPFGWGDPVKTARQKAGTLSPVRDAERPRFESEAIARVNTIERARERARLKAEQAEARATAKKLGRGARRLAPRPRRSALPALKPRLSTHRHRTRLLDHPANLDLHFVDDRLYAAVYRLLYPGGRGAIVEELAALLTQKYGAPLDPPDGSARAKPRAKWVFGAPDGDVVLLAPPPPPKARGLVEITYRHERLDKNVVDYLESLATRLAELESAPEIADPASSERQKQRAETLQRL